MPANSSQIPDTDIPKPLGSSLTNSNFNDTEYELVYPYSALQGIKEIGEMRSLDAIDSKTENITKLMIEKKVHSDINNFRKAHSANETMIDNHISINKLNKELHRDNRLDKSDSKNSSKTFSNMYWRQYKNFSSDFFDNSVLEQPSYESKERKDYQDLDLWGTIQRFYSCVWSAGLFSCLQERFGQASDSLLYLQFLMPRLPRLQVDEEEDGSVGRNDKFDYENSDQDAGRKKLSKKIQLLLPILVMLKMTMLPALAMMALVSGKAFLMSLLSLGVALVAASIHPHSLSANKRHEIAAQPQYPTDPANSNSNYYYMM
ncbi:hypothetical protein J6590_000965 [Homalodisca vitripennis]|nr:hypothetical protein J6590_000965 [Homalodisca vitripennis]